jgi:ADP-ribosyl-[dinitrogen reductase] hydrolase
MNDTKDKLNKELGMLLGVHVGDSLGATLEFQKERSLFDLHKEIIGGGFFKWKPGAATDDTDLTICLLESLVQHKKFEIYDFSERLLYWLRSNPIDIGETTKKSLKKLKYGRNPLTSGSSKFATQGNGSLMRCSPLALLNVPEIELNLIVKNQASITHSHKNCIDADIIFIYALKLALSGETKDQIFDKSVQLAKQINKSIFLKLIKVKETSWLNLKTTGFVIDTLGAAFWGLINLNSFEEALIMVVNRGDDSDTTGAVTGALCGAYYGLNSIPVRWLDCLQRKDNISTLYSQLQLR